MDDFNLGQDMDVFNGVLDEESADPETSTDTPADTQTGNADDQTASDDGYNKDQPTNTTTTDSTDKATEEGVSDITTDAATTDTPEGETDISTILDDLLGNAKDKQEDVEEGKADADKVLDETIKGLEKANLRIKELESSNELFQNKYFEKFGEASEFELMKPMLETINSNPSLKVLINAFRSGDGNKLDTLVKLLEDETGIDVSTYLQDNGKAAVSGVTSTGSDYDPKPSTKNTADFIPDATTEDLDKSVF